MKFPERVFTEAEVKRAREFIKKGFKHQLMVLGSLEFKKKVNEALDLIKLSDHYDFLRTYIRQIVEIDGFSQLREGDALIWLNKLMLEDQVDAASYIIQKAQQMKDYIEGKPYYGIGEISSIEKRIEFLKILKEKSENHEIRLKCKNLLQKWTDSTYLFP